MIWVKCRAWPREVKKIVSKQSPHLEPGAIIEVTIIPGREIDHLAKAQPIEYFPLWRQDLIKSKAVAYALSLSEKITAERSRDLNFFWFLRHWLLYLETSTGSVSRLLDAFVLGILVCLGFAPELSACVVCGREQNEIYKEALTNPVQKPGLFYAGGGLICVACRKIKQVDREKIVDLGLAECNGLKALLSGDWKIVENFTISETEEKSLHQVIYEFLRYHVELPFRDWR